MSLPWTTVDTAATPDGKLVLQRRGERDHLITLDGRVLMNSMTHRSEAALGALACVGLAARERPRVLVGGLGMAFTLRAVLDAVPASASVTVAELNPVIVAWCRGPIADLTARAVDDPRVSVVITDFADALREAAGSAHRLDAIVIDLYVGPDHDTRAADPLYGSRACQQAFTALRPGGVFAIWAEGYHESYAKRLAAAGFHVAYERPAKGNRRFVVYLATKPATA
jgi:spermidine synthase